MERPPWLQTYQKEIRIENPRQTTRLAEKSWWWSRIVKRCASYSSSEKKMASLQPRLAATHNAQYQGTTLYHPLSRISQGRSWVGSIDGACKISKLAQKKCKMSSKFLIRIGRVCMNGESQRAKIRIWSVALMAMSVYGLSATVKTLSSETSRRPIMLEPT